MSESLKFRASDLPLIAVIAISGFLFVGYFGLILNSDPVLLMLILVAFATCVYELKRNFKERGK